jgi:hypothetical protein
MAHRATWEKVNGHIPSGLIIRHKCDNRACVNPAHMELGRHQDNRRDTVERGRHAKGEKMAAAKLTEEKVKEIRARYVPFVVTRAELAKEYCVSVDLIHKVVNRIYWKHVA